MDFAEQKKRTLDQLGKDDASRQGHVDDEVLSLLETINANTAYYTTSSCAGRILVYEDHPSKQKKDVRWLLSSHQEVALPDVMTALNVPTNYTLWLRFEPLILHVCCTTHDAAERLLALVHESGFKHSGVLSLRPRIIVEVISSERIDVPLGKEGKLLVDAATMIFFLEEANRKLKANAGRREELKKKIAGLNSN
jgi:tRNA wybutosine-synthesizing protein 3